MTRATTPVGPGAMSGAVSPAASAASAAASASASAGPGAGAGPDAAPSGPPVAGTGEPRRPGRGAVPKVRDDLAGMTPYGAPQLDVPVRLNTNETPYEVPPTVLDDLAATVRGLGDLHRYPDREAVELRTALAAHTGHVLAGTWAANGSNEILQQLLQAYGGPGRRALVVEPTYAMHSLIARVTATEVVTEVLRRDVPVTPERAAALVAGVGAEVTFWCSPNNPTGEAASPEVTAAVCAAAPGLVVLDEAYGEFGRSHAADLLGRHPNLVVTRTFSKAFRLAGLRLGYMLADPAIVDSLRLVRLPYHLSSLTQAAALCALRHAPTLMSHIAVTAAERDRVAAALAELPGVGVLPSDANFLAFSVPGRPRPTWQALLDHGVLVRDISGAPTMERYLRVTIGTPEENDAFLTALAEVLDA
jgi:histidinol-phosphate aminotransferase